MVRRHESRLLPEHQRQEHSRQECGDHRRKAAGHGAAVKAEHQREDSDVNHQADPASRCQLDPQDGNAYKHYDAVDQGGEIEMTKCDVHVGNSRWVDDRTLGKITLAFERELGESIQSGDHFQVTMSFRRADEIE